MLTAFLALQSYMKDLPCPLIAYLYMDNTSAISYLKLQGRDNISIPQLPCQGNLAMVHVSEHLTSSQPPFRTPQHISRYGIQDDKRQTGLAITHQNFPQDQSEMGSIYSGSVCIQTHTPTASIFQLKTRSSGSSIRCIPSSVVITDKLCKPSVRYNIEGAIRNQSPTSRSSYCTSNLEESVLVPMQFCYPYYSTFPPHNIPTRSTAVPGVSAISIPASGSTADCMAHLRSSGQGE